MYSKRKISSIIAVFLALIIVAVQVFAGSQVTSSTAASSIITRARYYLNEATASFWADAELLAWINQGTLDIVARTRCLEATASISLADSTVEYALSPTITSYIDISTVTYVDSSSDIKGLIRRNPQSVGNVAKTDLGEPVFWYEWAGSIGVFPYIPSVSTTTTETVTVYYVTKPAALSATTELVLVPAIYDQALTLYVAAQALLKEKKYEKSGALMSAYHAELDRFRQDHVEQTREPPESVYRYSR